MSTFIKERVGQFFDLLHHALKAVKLQVDRIFRFDEIGITIITICTPVMKSVHQLWPYLAEMIFIDNRIQCIRAFDPKFHR